MNRFPFFGYPYRYYNYYPKYSKQEPLKNDTKEDYKQELKEEDMHNNRYQQKKSSKSSPFTFNFDGFTSNDEAIVTLYGIKLYLDDLIILGLLYVLYQEEVKDEMLFISLLLLLLS